MGYYNKKSISRKVTRSKSFAKFAHKKMRDNLERAKRKMVGEFDAHPVTREISAGPSAVNISNTLTGYGNLFTFIGFSSGESPTSAVREYLLSAPKIVRSRLVSNSMIFTIEVPALSDFKNISRMPWEGGRSWLQGIETGISGFSYYMAYVFNSKSSRSGGGLQVANKIRSGSYRTTPYMTPILRRFIKEMSRG
jgi:hypothetical protein